MQMLEADVPQPDVRYEFPRVADEQEFDVVVESY